MRAWRTTPATLLNIVELILDLNGPTPEAHELNDSALAIYEILQKDSRDKSYARSVARAEINRALLFRKVDAGKSRPAVERARRVLVVLTADDQNRRQSSDPDDLYYLALVEALE